jgi:LysM repeat protein
MAISLSEFKRPPADNGRGVHGSATIGWKGGERGLDYWVGELQALGVKWVKLLDDQGDSLPFCQKLATVGIFPVVRILRRDPPPNDSAEPNPGHLSAKEEDTIKRLIDAGVFYFETNNEPNLATQWKNGAIPANLEEAAKLVALNWLFDARFILEAGGYPALPAISGGEEFDLIGALVSLGRQDVLLDGCWIAIHNYALNRPLIYPSDKVNQTAVGLGPNEYDAGALTTWMWWNPELGRADTPEEVNQMRVRGKNTGQTILQAHACFREHEYYDALAQKYLGRSIPILSTEGGVQVGRRDDLRYPRITPLLHADMTVALFEFMQRDAPEYYFTNMPSLLVPSPRREQDAWYGNFWERAFKNGQKINPTLPPFAVPEVSVGDILPVVAAVKQMPNITRSANAPVPLPMPTTAPMPVVIAAPPPPPSSGENIYLVQHGDTLAAIAKKFMTSVDDIADANQLFETHRIFAGQRLVIPAARSVPPPPTPPATEQIETPKPAAPPPPPPKPPAPAAFDPRLGALNVRVERVTVSAGAKYWRLVKAEYQDPTQSDGNHHIYFSLIDANGKPVAFQRVAQGWAAGHEDAFTDESGRTTIAMWASYAPDRGEVGPYSAWVDGLPSDRVVGLGLPSNLHVNFRLTWQRLVK